MAYSNLKTSTLGATGLTTGLSTVVPTTLGTYGAYGTGHLATLGGYGYGALGVGSYGAPVIAENNRLSLLNANAVNENSALRGDVATLGDQNNLLNNDNLTL